MWQKLARLLILSRITNPNSQSGPLTAWLTELTSQKQQLAINLLICWKDLQHQFLHTANKIQRAKLFKIPITGNRHVICLHAGYVIISFFIFMLMFQGTPCFSALLMAVPPLTARELRWANATRVSLHNYVPCGVFL